MNPRVLVLCTLALLVACHRDASQQAPAAPKPAPKVRAPVAPARGPTVEEQTAGMVEAASQGKGAAVALKFDVLERPTVGAPLEIAIALVPQIAASPATVEVTGSEGLTLASGEGKFEIPSVEAGQVYRHSIKVTPTTEGVLVMSLNVGLKHDEMIDSRVFSMPLIVAPAAAAGSTGASSTTAAAGQAAAPAKH